MITFNDLHKQLLDLQSEITPDQARQLRVLVTRILTKNNREGQPDILQIIKGKFHNVTVLTETIKKEDGLSFLNSDFAALVIQSNLKKIQIIVKNLTTVFYLVIENKNYHIIEVDKDQLVEVYKNGKYRRFTMHLTFTGTILVNRTFRGNKRNNKIPSILEELFIKVGV